MSGVADGVPTTTNVEERLEWFIDQVTGTWLNEPEGLDGSLGKRIVDGLKMYGHGLWPAIERMAELERREALLTAFVVAEDRFNAMMDSGDWDGDDGAYLTMMAARQALTEAGFPWSDAQ